MISNHSIHCVTLTFQTGRGACDLYYRFPSHKFSKFNTPSNQKSCCINAGRNFRNHFQSNVFVCVMLFLFFVIVSVHFITAIWNFLTTSCCSWADLEYPRATGSASDCYSIVATLTNYRKMGRNQWKLRILFAKLAIHESALTPIWVEVASLILERTYIHQYISTKTEQKCESQSQGLCEWWSFIDPHATQRHDDLAKSVIPTPIILPHSVTPSVSHSVIPSFSQSVSQLFLSYVNSQNQQNTQKKQAFQSKACRPVFERGFARTNEVVSYCRAWLVLTMVLSLATSAWLLVLYCVMFFSFLADSQSSTKQYHSRAEAWSALDQRERLLLYHLLVAIYICNQTAWGNVTSLKKKKGNKSYIPCYAHR